MPTWCDTPDGAPRKARTNSSPLPRGPLSSKRGYDNTGSWPGDGFGGGDEVSGDVVRRWFSVKGSSYVAGLEALDGLNIGVAVMNSGRQLLFANQTAEQIMVACDGLEVTAQGVLGTSKKSPDLALGELLRQASQASPSAKSRGRDTILAVKRTSGKRPLTLLVRSITERSLRSDANGPAVLVFMLDPERPIPAMETALRQLYGLTACEARLANLLMEGKTFDDCCDHLAIRPSTARMHLGNLFAKTGVQRQGQLISLLLKSLGMVRTKNDDRRTGDAGTKTELSEGPPHHHHLASHSREIVAAGLEALDLLEIGVVVTNRFRQLLFANETAEQILSARDGLEVTAQGVLATPSSSCSPALSDLIRLAAEVASSGTSERKDAVTAVQRPSGKRQLTLMVRSITERSLRSDANGPAVLVFMLDPERPIPAMETALRQLYGLTACEARLANLLMEGKTFDDCCDHLAIRPSTARMHLGNLFAKTGVQRQGQLISLLLKSLGMVRTTAAESRHFI